MKRKTPRALSIRQHVLQPILKILQNLIDGNVIRDNSLKSSVRKVFKVALQAVRKAIKKAGGRKKVHVPRLILFPAKVGGILQLISIFAGLEDLGFEADEASYSQCCY